MRCADRQDLPELAALFRETILTHGPTYYTPEQTYAWAALALDRDRFQAFILDVTTYVAEDDSGILGFAGIDPTGRVSSVYVRHDRLGQGIGSILLERVLAHAQRDRIARLYTEASEFSIKLFRKFSFHQYDTEIVERYGVTFTRCLMERVLGSQGSHSSGTSASG